MAVSASPEPLLKSQPDVNKLNAFTSPIVTVTKHKAARGTPGTSVVSSQPMKAAQILELSATLPLTYGAGYYKFTVADTAGGDSDAWMVALGPEPLEVNQMPALPPSYPPAGMSAPPVNAPLDPETKQIMPGWFYNETTQLLMTPWREAVVWRQGEPLPKPPQVQQQAGAPHLSLVPPNAQPWSWPPQSSWGGGGWGGYSVGSDSDELKATKAQLEEMKRQRELDEMRAEQRRRDDEQRRRDDERARETREMFEKMAATIAAVTAKPSGQSESEQRLERQLEEEKRRREESDREMRRREDERKAEEARREEMRLIREGFDRTVRELTTNKGPDPMVGMLSSLVQSIQTSAAETVRTVKDTIAASAASSERFMLHPAQVMDMVKSGKDEAASAAQMALATAKEMMGAQKEMYTSLLDIAGNSGQPAWVGLASEAMGKIGAIGQALAERNQREAAQAQYTPPVRPVQRVQRPQAQTATPQQRQQVQQQPGARPVPIAPPTGRPGQMDTGGRPPGTAFDPKAEEFVLADGMRIKQADVEREGWKKSIAEAIRLRGQQQGQVQEQEPVAGGLNGTAPAVNGAAGHVNAAPAPANKRGKKKPQAAAPPVVELEPPPVEPEPAFPPPANPAGYTLAEMRDLEPEHVAEAVSAIPDPDLFGDLWQYVPQLRQSTDPKQIVAAILQGQQFLNNSGKTAPAMDLLAAEQLDVFVYRLLPAAPDDFRETVVEMLAEAMGLTGGDNEEANG